MLNAFNNRLTVAARGVRKINEQTIQEGRALVITDDAPYSWSDIPNGSLKVDTETGIIYVKLRGESDWVPSNIRTDIPRDSNGNVIYGVNGTETGHTLLIAKDSKIVQENFTIVELDRDDHKFAYEDEFGQRYLGDQTDTGFYFELVKGHYAPGRNALEVIIDDCLTRSAASGGLIEVSETRFCMTEKLEEGMELTVKYMQIIRYGNPYPRIFLRRGNYDNNGIDTDEPVGAEIGDLWIDFASSPEQPDGYLGEAVSAGEDTVPWNRISGKPVLSTDDLNFMTDVSRDGHTHLASDISDFDMAVQNCVKNQLTTNQANYAITAGKAADSDKLQGKTVGISAGNIPEILSSGKISQSIIPTHAHVAADISDSAKLMPVNGIIMYYSPSGSIPAGWVLCNGYNGTPNLSSKFDTNAGIYYIMKRG